MTERPKPHVREEQAKREIGHTEISLGVKWTLFVFGLFTLFVVPAVQICRELRQHAEGRRESRWPQCCEIFEAWPRAAAACREHDGGWISKMLRGNSILLQAVDKYEKDLKAESFLTQSVLPPLQELLVQAGSGNEKAYVGRRGWLFYRPGIDYCTGPGFLNLQYMARRADSGTQWQSAPQVDPRAAILQFHRQLAERNIRLVLMPTPAKATIHPEKFSSRYEGQRLSVHNPSYRQLLDELEAAGVLVCDVANALAQFRDRSGNAVYLATDTHWRPEAMELAAAELARFIEQKTALDTARADRDWRRTTKKVKNLGDIALMLRLRQNQGIFAKEPVTIHPVVDAAGRPWRPNSAAEVLLLGDSFANIYSLEMMNWGCEAGLAEQLSFALNRPVDTILRNDEGAYAARELLSRELAQGHDRLGGKKVVVWQFAARELAVGDWKLLDMTLKQSHKPADGAPPAGQNLSGCAGTWVAGAESSKPQGSGARVGDSTGASKTQPQPPRRPSITNSCGHELIVSGTIVAKSAAPRAGQMPYADHIFTLDLTDLQVHGGTLPEPKIAVYLFSMRNHQNTPAFSWPVGKRVKLKLQPWRPKFFARYGRINRTETDDAKLESPWWGEVIE
jgi:alginate O-acetyltransferase complex protein AlgJ